ncbi:alpha/beta fold hydrolase [Emticicia sp. SJ17W-69]|uniref:alpha/beta fold hydrolase n=1 Tax=Emticicia sp. SJ17W-69 TaxID=3421657 RepID=UPI003EBB1A4A
MTRKDHNTVDIEGTTISFDDFGKGEVPIIFIHGFPFDKSSWQPQIDFLKKRHRVIAYDIRGFGASITNDEQESIDLFSNDLVKFMDTLSIKKAIVCGLSMGGYILLNAVHRFSDRFEAIILSDTQCIADSEAAKEKRGKSIKQIEAEGLKDFADGFIKNVFCQNSLDNKKELVETIKNVILKTSQRTVVGTLAALAQRSEMCASLNQISVPTLIICGKEDSVTPPIQAEFMYGKILNSRLQIIENAGHLSNLEQPDEFNKILIDFISSIEN